MRRTTHWWKSSAADTSSSAYPRFVTQNDAARATAGSWVVVDEHDPSGAHELAEVNQVEEDSVEAVVALRDQLAASDKLTEANKLDLVADIESLKDQLAKPSPNPTVVRTLWSGIEKAAAVAGLAELALTVAPHVQQLLG